VAADWVGEVPTDLRLLDRRIPVRVPLPHAFRFDPVRRCGRRDKADAARDDGKIANMEGTKKARAIEALRALPEHATIEEAIGFRSWPVAVYAVMVLAAFHLRVVLHEEPRLARMFGDAWIQYRTRVSRWL
jgi:hypothetical protein